MSTTSFPIIDHVPTQEELVADTAEPINVDHDAKLPPQEWCQLCAQDLGTHDEDSNPGMAAFVLGHSNETLTFEGQDQHYVVAWLSCGHTIAHPS